MWQEVENFGPLTVPSLTIFASHKKLVAAEVKNDSRRACYIESDQKNVMDTTK